MIQTITRTFPGQNITNNWTNQQCINFINFINILWFTGTILAIISLILIIKLKRKKVAVIYVFLEIIIYGIQFLLILLKPYGGLEDVLGYDPYVINHWIVFLNNGLMYIIIQIGFIIYSIRALKYKKKI